MVGKREPRLLLTLESPSGRTAVSVPSNTPVEELLPGLVQASVGIVDPSGWTLAAKGEAMIDGARTFAEAGLYSGAVVQLIPPPRGPERPSAPAPPRPAQPPKIESMGEWDYLRTLDRALAAGNPLGSQVIAVVGAQVGAGATTVSALLATFLASVRPERVACVDANPQSGALSQWMVPDSALPVTVYRSLLESTVSPQMVEGALVSVAPRLWVMPAARDTSAGAGDGAAWSRLIEHMRRLRNVVVLDCGAGTQRETVKAAVQAADRIVLVTKPETSPKEPAHWSKPIVWVSNQSQRRARIQRTGNVPHITIAIEQQAAAMLKRRGFAWSEAPLAWQEAVRELAAVLVASGAAENPRREIW